MTTPHTRRTFLRQGSMTCLAAGLLGQFNTSAAFASVPTQPNNSAPVFDPRLLRSTFLPHLSGRFSLITGSGASVILRLLEINDLAAQRRLFLPGKMSEARVHQLRDESFSLLFHGPHKLPLRQQTYQLTHPEMGKIALFLTPVEKVAGSRLYEAVFNRSLV